MNFDKVQYQLENNIAVVTLDSSPVNALNSKLVHELSGIFDFLTQEIEQKKVRVVIVTGSGKTLAFYLPALLVSAERLSKEAAFTKVLSIYPRNELLKDQLTTALGLVIRINAEIRSQRGLRPISVGAYYGDTP